MLLFKLIAAWCLWTTTPEGRLVIGTLSPQVYSQERVTQQLLRQLAEDGTLEELQKVEKQLQNGWKKQDQNDPPMG